MPNKQALDKLEAAKTTADSATERLNTLLGQVDAERENQRLALEAHERAHLEAFAEEIAKAKADTQANEKRHRDQCTERHQRILARAAANPGPIDHAAIKVFTADGHTHEVVSAHGLMLGTKGFGSDKPREGSRYRVACGLAVDAAHAELADERFDQTKAPNCPKCGGALAMMDSGEIPDLRGDYLTSKEQLAHARAENKLRNAMSGRGSRDGRG